jgi:hypothetical protein
MSKLVIQSAVRLSTMLCAVAIAGCTVQAPPPRMRTPAGNSYAEWHNAAEQNLKQLQLPVIPPPNSEQFRKELADIRRLQASLGNAENAQIEQWKAGAVVSWNAIARDLVMSHKVSPPAASRVYALLSVAQALAIDNTLEQQQRFKRKAPSHLDPAIQRLSNTPDQYTCPSLAAAIASASAGVLTHLFPSQLHSLEDKMQSHMQSRLLTGENVQSDLDAGQVIGLAASKAVLARAKVDGADAVWVGALPAGSGMWRNAPNQQPLLPMWGRVMPWHLDTPDQFRPPPPPTFGSDEFIAALWEVRDLSDRRTPEQLRIAKMWADGPGTETPSGHWNIIAAHLITERGMSEHHAARIFSLMNTTMMDAGIACWDAKYHYMLLRPSQADAAITLPVGLPNFPSYVSGHASFSGAASEVLAHFFPDQSSHLRALADEAALSRVYGGIHYRFDGEQGLKLGRAVAALALTQALATYKGNQ